MNTTWTLPELVAEAARRIGALPAPKNGQIRAVPDERTIRYYAALGLLDRPALMKGRTALYSARHLAQVVAIKRKQSAGKSLAEIEALWPGMDDGSLARMTGIAIERTRGARAEFWKKGLRTADYGLRPEAEAEPKPDPQPSEDPDQSAVRSPQSAVQLHLTIQLAPGVALVLDAPTPPQTYTLTHADLRAIRAAAAPLIAVLAKRGTMEES